MIASVQYIAYGMIATTGSTTGSLSKPGFADFTIIADSVQMAVKLLPWKVH